MMGVRPIGVTVADNVLVLVTVSDSDTYKVTGYSTGDGRKLWARSAEGKLSPSGRYPGGIVIVEAKGSEKATLVFRDLNGEEISRTPLGFSTPWGAPVVVGNRVIAGGLWSFGRCMVECYDTGDLSGGPLWRWDDWLAGEEPPQSGFVVLDGKCIFTGPLGRLVVLDMETGKEQVPRGGLDYEFIAPPVSNGNLVFGITSDGLIGAVDPSGPEVAWVFRLQGGLKPQRGQGIGYYEGRIYCPCRGGILVAIE
jgi:hypothetical protein